MSERNNTPISDLSKKISSCKTSRSSCSSLSVKRRNRPPLPPLFAWIIHRHGFWEFNVICNIFMWRNVDITHNECVSFEWNLSLNWVLSAHSNSISCCVFFSLYAKYRLDFTLFHGAEMKERSRRSIIFCLFVYLFISVFEEKGKKNWLLFPAWK